MKIVLPGFVLCLVLLGGCGSKTSVSLQFQHAAGKDVLVLEPVNHNYLGITDTIKGVKDDSVYRIGLDIQQMAPIRFLVGEHELTLFVGPGDQLSVNCDLQQKQPFRITGDNASGETLYNHQSKNKNPYKYEFVGPIEYPLDTIPERVEQYFRELQQKEIAQYDSLYRLEQISADFLNYVRKDIRLYYSMTLSKIANALALDKNNAAFGQFWTKLYEEHPLQEEDLNIQWKDDYARFYLMHYLPYRENIQFDATSGQSYYEFVYDIYSQHISNPEVLKSVLGTRLFIEALNNKTGSLDILPCFEKFDRCFPGNPYTSHWAPFRRSLETYQQKIQGDFSPEVRFVEGFEGISSLAELIGRFKGKPVFIDFWFSTCGPCRKEFAYAESLDKFLKSRHIQSVYISIDEEHMDKNWKNSIKYFGLKGWQIRASKALRNDLYNQYGIDSFPTYMLVDATGHIVLPNAKRPSEKEALYRQISEALENP